MGGRGLLPSARTGVEPQATSNSVAAMIRIKVFIRFTPSV